LQEVQKLFDSGELQDLVPMYNHDCHCEVKYHVLVAFEQKDLPDFIKQAEVYDSGVKCHNPLCSVHFHDNFALLEVHQQLFV
jgi:hypothetical protein